MFSKTADGRTTTVPVHSGETIGPGLLRSIVRDVELSIDELLASRSGAAPYAPRFIRNLIFFPN